MAPSSILTPTKLRQAMVVNASVADVSKQEIDAWYSLKPGQEKASPDSFIRCRVP